MARPRMTPDQRRESLVRRFWEKIERDAPCWGWKGSSDKAGYAVIWNGSNMIHASRVSYEIHNDVTLEPHQYVCHSCDNPICTNPEHLWIGSHNDNMRDMKDKGRALIAKCARGHRRAGSNLYFRPDGKGTECRECRSVNASNRTR